MGDVPSMLPISCLFIVLNVVMPDQVFPKNGKLSCRGCGKGLAETFVDLGATPLANSYVDPSRILEPEPFYSLHAYVCPHCWLVQLPAVEQRETIFNEDYAYFSSFSSTILSHAKGYVAEMTERFGIGPEHRVVEIASNDGYLLQYFHANGVPTLGIEPSAGVAKVARENGLPTEIRFFGRETGKWLQSEGLQAKLLHGANVLAHVPDIDDFVSGFHPALAEGGVLTMEFPHLLNLIEKNYYDTIYHEHYSYLSLIAVREIFERHKLKVFEVQEIAPQGGSLRVFACRTEDVDTHHPVLPSVAELEVREVAEGLTSLNRYRDYAKHVHKSKRDLLRFLMDAQEAGKTVVGYGAPAKGNTLLNFCGVKTDLLEYTVDVSTAKMGKLLPGTRIPIHAPDKIFETRPDYVLILPWNIKEEIMDSMKGIVEWGGRFVVPLPEVRVLE
ncbi:class I SAM-dependent methyltransferase [Ruegeria arenilitoris]|uniref:class I SAM-dependent methyltransferase n=1 Tax=Ruegeria arenilitoris TaxID=1173585 RepID=UPI001C2B859C|nr:class I SAM-dependent methyltransferase [Ruegeria arenilitoris]